MNNDQKISVREKLSVLRETGDEEAPNHDVLSLGPLGVANIELISP